MKNSTSINIPILARVEGEGALEINIQEKKIESLRLKIYEPPRLFEKFLEGRPYGDVLDFVARICGICPVAYQMSAAHAIENAFDIRPSAWTRALRRLFYCGEWIESHAMHIHFLAAPDFFGFDSALNMAKEYPEEIRRGLRLQSLGNSLIRFLGGRSVHPVGACIGGFYRAPTAREAAALLEKINASINDAEQLIAWTAAMQMPKETQDFISVSLVHLTEYPMNEGRICSSAGLDIPIEAFEDYFQEHQVSYSNALHCLLQGQDYLVGPLARINLNHTHLPERIQTLLQQLHLHFPSKNMYHSIIARAIEIYYCILEAQNILKAYEYPSASTADVSPKAGIGFGCTEAPRGLLWHSYQLDAEGVVKQAKIVPPTSQNQARIESDLRFSLEKFGLTQTDDALRARSEMIIRNYDPCISCSTHFIDLRVKRL